MTGITLSGGVTPMFKKSLNRSVGGNLLLLAVLILMACFMLLPIVYAVVTAFKPLDEIYIFPRECM